jgi:hypothetical protein
VTTSSDDGVEEETQIIWIGMKDELIIPRMARNMLLVGDQVAKRSAKALRPAILII